MTVLIAIFFPNKAIFQITTYVSMSSNLAIRLIVTSSDLNTYNPPLREKIMYDESGSVIPLEFTVI